MVLLNTFSIGWKNSLGHVLIPKSKVPSLWHSFNIIGGFGNCILIFLCIHV